MSALQRYLLTSASASILALTPFAVWANPLNGQVVGGSASIAGQGTNQVTVNQSSNRAIVNWQSFNVAPNETTQFVQPSVSSVILNRVTGGMGASQINGMLKANGGVYVVNPDGIVFGPSANVNVGSFLATTHNVTNNNFMAGKDKFLISGKPSASIVNQGHITAATGGFAALVAPGVRNDGVISAKLGTVALVSGNRFTLDLYGDNLIKLQPHDAITQNVVDAVTGQPLKSLVQNNGKLKANGGVVTLTAVTAKRALDSVINNRGVIEANSVGMHHGMVVFGAVTSGSARTIRRQVVRIAGTVSVAGKHTGTSGGTINVTGKNIRLASATLDASGQTGGGKIIIGTSTASLAPAASGQSTQSKPAPDSASVKIDAKSTLNASAITSGNGGSVVITSKGTTSFEGSIVAMAAQNGIGGSVETSGRTLSIDNSHVNAGPSGHWLLDPYDLTIGSPAAQSIDNTLNGGTSVLIQTTASGTTGPGTANASGSGDIIINSAIAWNTSATLSLSAYRNIDINANITASGGGSLSMTTGTGGGAGDYNIATGSNVSFTGGASSGSTLSINGQTYTLLYNASDVQNINASNAALGGYYALATSIDATNAANWTPIGTDGNGNIGNAGAGFSGTFAGLGNTISNLTVNLSSSNYVGLFGYSSGTIRDVNIGVQSVSGTNYVGGLVGYNTGTITNAGVNGSYYTLNGIVGLNDVGGLVGKNTGGISGSFAAVTVSDSSIGSNLGGLVGINTGSISQSYATGTVADFDEASNVGVNVGGFVGNNIGQITNAYATGTVVARGGEGIGGFAGINSGTLSEVLATGWIGDANGTDHGGLVGNNKGTIVNGYWNIDTTNQPNGVGPDSQSDNAIGLTSASGPDPFQASSYAGFNFNGGIWNIVPGLSFPYLQFQFPNGTPQVISGHGTRAPNLPPDSDPYPFLYGFTVGALVNGAPVGLTTFGYDGFYNLLVAPGTISSSGSQVLSYIVGAVSSDSHTFYNPTGDSFFDNATGSVTGLDISGHYVALYSGASTVTGIAQDLAIAQGTNRNSDFIFSVSASPNYTLKLIDPVGLPTGTSLVIYSSAANFNLDQVPSFGSPTDFLSLNMTSPNAVLTQTSAVDVGRLSLIGNGASFVLTDTDNTISTVAGNAGTINIADSELLHISRVNTITGITATNLILADPAGVAEAQAINVSNLLLRGGGANFTLKNSNNVIGTLAANTNKITIVDSSSLVIGEVNGLNGVSATNVSISTIGAGSNIIIQNLLSTTATADLEPDGSLTESGDGSIQAKKLQGSSVGGTSLTGTNLITSLGNFTNSGSGDFSLVNAQSFSAAGVLVQKSSGSIMLTTSNGKIAIGKYGVINGDTVTLNSADKIGESASGQIDANILNATANTGIALVGNNNISNVGTDHTNSGPNKINK